MPSAGGYLVPFLLKRRYLDINWKTQFSMSHVHGAFFFELPVQELSHLFFVCFVYLLPHPSTYTQVSFWEPGFLSYLLLSLYFKVHFCCCLLKGKKCLTYKISSNPQEKECDLFKSGLLFGLFIHWFILQKKYTTTYCMPGSG